MVTPAYESLNHIQEGRKMVWFFLQLANLNKVAHFYYRKNALMKLIWEPVFQ